jgi:hypothetical protein
MCNLKNAADKFSSSFCKADTEKQKADKTFQLHDACRTKFDPIGRTSSGENPGQSGKPMYQYKLDKYLEDCPENKKPKIDIPAITSLLDAAKTKLLNNQITEENATKLKVCIEAIVR